MNTDVLTNYYNKAGERYRMSSTRGRRVLKLLDYALDNSVAAKPRVLDIGIGNAEIAKHVHTRYGSDRPDVIGLDIAPKLLEEHKGLYDSTICVNVDDPDFGMKTLGAYDIVVATELLEHLFRPDEFLKRIADVMSHNGFLLVSTPNMLLWSQRIKFLLGRQAYSNSGVFEWGHIHLFSWPFLQKCLNEAGFDIVQTRHLLYPNSLERLKRFLPPGVFAFQFIVLARKR